MGRTPSINQSDLATDIVKSTKFPPGWRTPYIKNLGTSPPPSKLGAVADWFAQRVVATVEGSYIAGIPPLHGTDDEFRAAAFVAIPSVTAAISGALRSKKQVTVISEGTAYNPDTDQKPNDESELVAATVANASRKMGLAVPAFDTWDDDPVNVYDATSPIWVRLTKATGDLDTARAAIAVRMLAVGASVDVLHDVGILDDESAIQFKNLTGRNVPKKSTKPIRSDMRRLVYPHETDQPPSVISAISALYDSMRASNLLRKIHDTEQNGGVAVAIVPPWMGYALKPVIERQNEHAQGQHKTSAKRKQLGDCYQVAGKYIMDHGWSNPRLRLVHGEVSGQGPMEGMTYGHAWILDGDLVIDQSNGRNIRLPRQIYYSIGNIEWLNNYYEYTVEQALEKMEESMHYGPWDLKTRSGK